MERIEEKDWRKFISDHLVYFDKNIGRARANGFVNRFYENLNLDDLVGVAKKRTLVAKIWKEISYEFPLQLRFSIKKSRDGHSLAVALCPYVHRHYVINGATR